MASRLIRTNSESALLNTIDNEMHLGVRPVCANTNNLYTPGVDDVRFFSRAPSCHSRDKSTVAHETKYGHGEMEFSDPNINFCQIATCGNASNASSSLVNGSWADIKVKRNTDNTFTITYIPHIYIMSSFIRETYDPSIYIRLQYQDLGNPAHYARKLNNGSGHACCRKYGSRTSDRSRGSSRQEGALNRKSRSRWMNLPDSFYLDNQCYSFNLNGLSDVTSINTWTIHEQDLINIFNQTHPLSVASNWSRWGIEGRGGRGWSDGAESVNFRCRNYDYFNPYQPCGTKHSPAWFIVKDTIFKREFRLRYYITAAGEYEDTSWSSIRHVYCNSEVFTINVPPINVNG